MPHVFAMLLGSLSTAERCLKSCSAFCKKCVEVPESVESSGTYIYAKTGKEETRELNSISEFSIDEAGKLVRDTIERRTQIFEKWQAAESKAAL